VLSILFEMVRMTPNLQATLTLITERGTRFRVTPKGRTGDHRHRTHVPRPLTAVLGLSFLAIAWYAATLLGATPVTYHVPWAVHAAFAWTLVNLVLVVLAIRRIRAIRFAGERRASVRFATDLPGRVDGIEAWIRDLSLTGARIEVPHGAEIGTAARLIVDTESARPIDLAGSTRAVWTDADGRRMIGFEFDAGQFDERARLALQLFGASTAAVESVPVKVRRRKRTPVETAA
jgi:hypothetical protein